MNNTVYHVLLHYYGYTCDCVMCTRTASFFSVRNHSRIVLGAEGSPIITLELAHIVEGWLFSPYQTKPPLYQDIDKLDMYIVLICGWTRDQVVQSKCTHTPWH